MTDEERQLRACPPFRSLVRETSGSRSRWVCRFAGGKVGANSKRKAIEKGLVCAVTHPFSAEAPVKTSYTHNDDGTVTIEATNRGLVETITLNYAQMSRLGVSLSEVALHMHRNLKERLRIIDEVTRKLTR